MSGRIADFQERGCEVLGVSTDDVETHRRWLTTPVADGGLGPISFPLAADPDGRTCQQYGVYVERQRVALRGLFIVDPNGVLQYQTVHSLSVGRSSDEVLRVLDALQSGGLCPGEREIGAATIDVLTTLGPGRLIGAYRIEEEIGSGAFGTVFRATDTILDRTVALKVLGDERSESLLEEARAAAALNHPNLCAVHTVDTANGAAIIVMEFVPGQPLSRRLQESLPSTEVAADFAQQIASGMAEAHRTGIVHGDLKPSNLIVTPEGIIKIMDFGLARRIIPSDSEDDTMHWSPSTSAGLSGTLSYLSPEQLRGGESTPATDVFALGLIVYEMLTGDRAMAGSNFADTLRRIDEFDVATHIQKIPDSWADLMSEMLAREASYRPTMDQVAARIAEISL